MALGTGASCCCCGHAVGVRERRRCGVAGGIPVGDVGGEYLLEVLQVEDGSTAFSVAMKSAPLM
jgi:hypothetical protein